MAQSGTGRNPAVPPPAETTSSRGSLPLEAQREIRTARYLVLLAFPFVVLLYYDLALIIALRLEEAVDLFVAGSGGLYIVLLYTPFVVGFGGLYVLLLYALVYRRLTRSELSGALGATLVLGVLTLSQGLIPLGWGLGLGGVSSAGDAFGRVLLALAAVPGVLLLLAYRVGARAERSLRGAVSTARA